MSCPASTPGISPKGETVIKLGLLLTFFGILTPIVSTAIPPVMDYPNHLARYWILSGGDRVWPISGMYRIDWNVSKTNIGIDFIFRVTGRILPFGAIAKSILAVSILGPPLGAVLLNRVIFNRWHWWQLGVPMLAWTTTALSGFLSYQVALCLALIAACIDPMLESSKLGRTAVRLACSITILCFHPFGLLFYVLLLIGLAIGPSWQGLLSKGRLIDAARHASTSALPAIAALGLLLLLAPTASSANIGHRLNLRWLLHFRSEVLTSLSPLLSYNLVIDLLFAALPIFLLAVAVRKKRVQSHAGLLIVCLATAVLALGMPNTIGSNGWTDRRLPLMAALLCCAGVQPDPFRSPRLRRVLALALFLLATARSAWIWNVWSSRERDVNSIEQALSHVRPGSAIFTVQAPPADVSSAPVGRFLAGAPGWYNLDSTLRHVPTLVVPQRHAFIPTLFAVLGQQPLRVLPRWNQISATNYDVPDARILDRPSSSAQMNSEAHLKYWWRRFDYVLLIGADQHVAGRPFVPSARLKPIFKDYYSILYQVVR